MSSPEIAQILTMIKRTTKDPTYKKVSNNYLLVFFTNKTMYSNELLMAWHKDLLYSKLCLYPPYHQQKKGQQTWPSGPVNSVSIASRVVPLTGLTIVLSSPTKAFSMLLLPTFGRPTRAIEGT